MRVTEGTSFALSDGSWLKPVVELDDGDFDRLIVDCGLSDHTDKINLVSKYELLSAYAKFLLVMNQLKSRMSDERWVSTEGKALLSAAREELASVIKSVVGDDD